MYGFCSGLPAVLHRCVRVVHVLRRVSPLFLLAPCCLQIGRPQSGAYGSCQQEEHAEGWNQLQEQVDSTVPKAVSNAP
jgi:hypothetical protein